MTQSPSQTELTELSRHHQDKNFKDLSIKTELLIKKYPNVPNLYNILGIAQFENKSFIQSIESFAKAIELEPRHIDAYNNQAKTYKKIKDYESSINILKKAIEINPNYYLTYSNLADLLSEIGEVEKSLFYYKKSLNLKPEVIKNINNYLFYLNYSAIVEDDFYFSEAKKFSKFLKVNKLKDLKNNFSKEDFKKIKVGFVSSDLRHHPVGYFLYETIKELKNFDLELFAYFNQGSEKEDDFSFELKKHFNKWENINHLSDMDVFNKIKKDKINILIDLSGYSSGNRLTVFALKAAPVQISWIGYLNTSGLDEIDYIIADPFVIDGNKENIYSEKIWKMPNIWNTLSKPSEEIISDLPAAKNNYITFGSFNNVDKINISVIKTWSSILKEVKNSKIFFKYVHFDKDQYISLIKKSFQKCGISNDRIIISGGTKRSEHLKMFNKIDISLDPFPYSGGTTSFESVWMGVPMLALKGKKFISNCGVSINTNLNMNDWIATSTEDYINKAVNFSKDISYLKNIRLNLRSKCLNSPLFDGKKFAKDFNDALINMWKIYNNK